MVWGQPRSPAVALCVALQHVLCAHNPGYLGRSCYPTLLIPWLPAVSCCRQLQQATPCSPSGFCRLPACCCCQQQSLPRSSPQQPFPLWQHCLQRSALLQPTAVRISAICAAGETVVPGLSPTASCARTRCALTARLASSWTLKTTPALSAHRAGSGEHPVSQSCKHPAGWLCQPPQEALNLPGVTVEARGAGLA